MAEYALSKDPKWYPWFMISFFGIFFVIFNVSPIFFGTYVAFTEWGIYGDPEWIGLDNFREYLEDEYAINAFKNVIFYALIIVPSVTCLAFLAAIFVNKGYPLSGFCRTMFFAPHIVSATVIGLVWVWILDTDYGMLNNIIKHFGISRIPWLTSMEWSLVGVSIASIWWDFGLAFILYLAALQDIPKDLIEASYLDGANRFQRMIYLLIPLTRPVIAMVITIQLIATLRIFSQVYVMTDGGPGGASQSPIHHIYSVAVQEQLFGYASAISIILFLFILIITLIQRFVIRESK
jgi:multiple sugar transport system permease protein